jgi:hypothetical protein
MEQTYISPSNTFSFEYPDDWKLDREDGGTLSLRKKGSLFKKESPYVLRITPMVSAEIISPEAYKALLNIRKKEHNDLEIIEKSDSFVMNFHILKYRKEVYQDVEDRTFLMFHDYWELVISNRIFTCWFSMRQGEEDSPKAKEEQTTAEKILYSIRLL